MKWVRHPGVNYSRKARRVGAGVLSRQVLHERAKWPASRGGTKVIPVYPSISVQLIAIFVHLLMDATRLRIRADLTALSQAFRSTIHRVRWGQFRLSHGAKPS